MESTITPKVRLVTVGSEDDGQRIDNYLTRELKGVPKSLIYRVIRKGEVRINKGRVQASYRLKPGDVIRIPPVRVSEGEVKLAPSESVKLLIGNQIIYEDKYVLVINKPSGIAVHGGSGIQYGVIEALRALFPKLQNLELVHRLDRDTSGCLMIAKKRSALRHLHEQIREKTMEKQYLALVRGQCNVTRLSVVTGLQKNTVKSGERIVRVQEDGKLSESIFNTEKAFGLATLVNVQAITGRTHQIRVHAAHIEHPIAGDEKYGDEQFNREMRNYGLKRLFLHARHISFSLPDSDEIIRITAPLTEDLQSVMRRLEKTGTVGNV